MSCVESASIVALVNGWPLSLFTPTHSLRKGDSLSPFLFLFCTEGLSSLLRQAEVRRAFCHVKISIHSPQISHLLFTDDTKLFIHEKQNVVRELLSVLYLYEAASGQKVNLRKSSMFFSPGISQERHRELSQLLGTSKCPTYDRYIGFLWSLGWRKVV